MIPDIQKKVILGQATQTTSRFSIPAENFLLATSSNNCDEDDQYTTNQKSNEQKETYTLIGIVSDQSQKDNKQSSVTPTMMVNEEPPIGRINTREKDS